MLLAASHEAIGISYHRTIGLKAADSIWHCLIILVGGSLELHFWLPRLVGRGHRSLIEVNLFVPGLAQLAFCWSSYAGLRSLVYLQVLFDHDTAGTFSLHARLLRLKFRWLDPLILHKCGPKGAVLLSTILTPRLLPLLLLPHHLQISLDRLLLLFLLLLSHFG